VRRADIFLKHDGRSSLPRVSALLLLVALLALGAASCSSSSTSATTSTPSTTASVPLPTTSTTMNPALSPLQRAYNTLINVSTYAIGMQTWRTSGESQTPELAVSAQGAKKAGWVYLAIDGHLQPPTHVELAISGDTAVARVSGAAWQPASDVSTAYPALQDLPLEDPTPLSELLPNILENAAPVSLAEAQPPSFAPAAPKEAATAFRWTIDLVTDSTVDATVTSTAWLDDRGRLIRLDRGTVPTDPAKAQTYTVITYSRFAEADIAAPVPPAGVTP
jgi:hypothetical protein